MHVMVFSPFSDRVELPLYNVLSPCLHVMDIFSVDLKFCHIRFNTIAMSFLVFQPVFCLQLRSPYISSPSPHHLSHHMFILSQPTTSNDGCDRMNFNHPQFFTSLSVSHENSTHQSNHRHLYSFKL